MKHDCSEIMHHTLNCTCGLADWGSQPREHVGTLDSHRLPRLGVSVSWLLLPAAAAHWNSWLSCTLEAGSTDHLTCAPKLWGTVKSLTSLPTGAPWPVLLGPGVQWNPWFQLCCRAWEPQSAAALCCCSQMLEHNGVNGLEAPLRLGASPDLCSQPPEYRRHFESTAHQTLEVAGDWGPQPAECIRVKGSTAPWRLRAEVPSPATASPAMHL